MTGEDGRKLFAEALGTAFLLAAVIGSGIMAEQLAGGNQALALLCNTIPTGAILVVIILVFGPISGAHFNPAVTVALGCAAGISVEQGSALHRRPVDWGACRRMGRALHVRPADPAGVHSPEDRRGSLVR